MQNGKAAVGVRVRDFQFFAICLATLLGSHILDVRSSSAGTEVGVWCPAEAVQLARVPLAEADLQGWNPGELLAYDLLNRLPTSPPRFENDIYVALGQRIQAAYERLPSAYSQPLGQPLIPYAPLLVRVKLTKPVIDELTAVAPPRDVVRVRGIKLPLTSSAGISRVCAEACGCWFDVNSNTDTVDLYLHRRTNLFYVVLELRKVPEVLSAGLQQPQRAIKPWKTGKTVAADFLTVEIVGDVLRFTATKSDDSGNLTSQSCRVTPAGIEEVSPQEASMRDPRTENLLLP